MFTLQYLDPITGRPTSRTFKTWNSWKKHIRKYHCDMNYLVTDLDNRTFRYGSYHVLDDFYCIGELYEF